tara:strand:+ start:3304 stop:4059 length:756 start_codon:yes stop_codon:yes gene_type:complete
VTKSVNLLDLKIKSKYQLNELLSKGQGNEFILTTFVNPFSYNVLLAKPELVGKMDVILSDGSLHKTLHNLFNPNKVDRTSFDFSSLAGDVFSNAEENNSKVVLIGAKPGLVDIAKSNFKEMYPSLNIVLTHHGYFKDEAEQEAIIKLADSCDPDIVIVGMGTPHQEYFLVKYSQIASNYCQLYTCGGFIEQSAIKADYYHPLIKKLGLRWLQRAVMHSHVRQRLIKDYPRFVIKYIAAHLRNRLISKAPKK